MFRQKDCQIGLFLAIISSLLVDIRQMEIIQRCFKTHTHMFSLNSSPTQFQ